jgi:hypothetical protein
LIDHCKPDKMLVIAEKQKQKLKKKKAQRIVNDEQSNQGFFFCCFNKHPQITHAHLHTHEDMILS